MSMIVCEFFFFSGPVHATWLSQFYLNNIDLLEKFIIYFKDIAGTTLRKAEKNRIIIPKERGISSIPILSHDRLDKRTQFLCEIGAKPIASESVSTKLTQREKEIAQNVLSGRSAIETAEKLVISRKTVERHIENIKIKLRCKNKSELIKKLLLLNHVSLVL